MDLSDPFRQFQVTSAICTSVAIVSTVYRLYIRRSRFWVDDGCACGSMIFLCVQLAAALTPLTSASGVTRYYLMITSFYLIVWTSRFAIIFSIIRIDPSKIRKRILHAGAGGFLLVCGLQIAQLYWTCEPIKAWKGYRIPQCPLSKQVAVTQIIFNTAADSVALVIPLRLLIVLQDRWLRSRLMIIFSTCMITTVVSLVHAILILASKGPAIVIVALVESGVSLIVCNVPVIATALLNLGQHSGGPHLPPSRSIGSSNCNRPVSIRFLSLDHLPSSQLSASVLLTEPPMAIRHESRVISGISARPSSVLLKPESDHPPRL
ncbi:hypothetical protein NMY22_g16817 [Coprinellus aureogranulatus]|nr:hypothetical protein NMY22_g16817 [Coprinellus aureogranulatus]